MLQEFTDTAIDFAEDAGTGGKPGTTNTLEEGDAPVIKLVHLIIQEAVTHAGLATSTSSRSPTGSGSATGSTAC